MPLLKATGFIADTWTFLGDDDPLPASGDIAVSWARLKKDWDVLDRHDGRLGVTYPNAERAEALRLHLPRLQLVVLAFPAFSDGRSYSIARQLRLDGYRGEIRARGDVLPDQLQFMLQVGFDALEVNERFEPAFWLRFLKKMTLTYQHDLADAATPQGAAPVWLKRQSRSPSPPGSRKANGSEP